MTKEQTHNERPCLTPGIETAQHVTRDGRLYFVIRNSAASAYLKLDSHDHALLPLMDGTRSIHDLAIADLQFRGVLAPLHVQGLVNMLRANAFLLDPQAGTHPAAAGQRHTREAASSPYHSARRVLSCELAFHDVDRRLAQLYRAVGWMFFTRSGVVIGMCLAILGPVLYAVEFAAGHFPELSMWGSYHIGLPVLMVAMFISLLAHELGHGMAVKHAGRHVPRAGLMLYFGLPTAYVTTTDIWMAPRRQRLIVSFAGPYMDLISCGICALAVLVCPRGAPREAAFTLGFFLLLRVLSALNPLVEMDGYYLLVDWIEKPLLRARALGFARVGLWAKLRTRQVLTRHEQLLALFGIASAACSGIMLALAFRFWELRATRLMAEGLTSTNPLLVVEVLVVIALISLPMLPSLSHLLRRLSPNAWMPRRPQRAALSDP